MRHQILRTGVILFGVLFILGVIRLFLPRFESSLEKAAQQKLAVPFEFALPSGWRMAAMPVALRFDSPLGSEHGGLTYNAQPFGARDVSSLPHLGDDLNGCYGYNSDFDDPVRAVADGLVIYANDVGGGWGGIVILLHRLRDNRLVQSFYGHLNRIETQIYDVVHRGQVIGTVGDAGGQYYAHLHFEMRAFANPYIGAGYGEMAVGWLDPTAFILEHRGAAQDDLIPSPGGYKLESEKRNEFR